MNKQLTFIAAGAALLAAGCTTMPSPQELDQQAQNIIKASFRDQGIAKVDRLQQDMSNAECSKLGTTPPPEAQGKAIEAANLKLVKWPADGRFLGERVKHGQILVGIFLIRFFSAENEKAP